MDYNVEIKKLLEKYPEYDLRYSLKVSGIGAGKAYICSLWKNGEYYLGIKGPCSLKDCYELLKNAVNK